MIFSCLLLTLVLQILPADAQISKEKNSMFCEVPAGASFRFDGVIGERIEANVNEWLLSAPVANPGMLEMFRVRDREPVPQVMPWAGEFAGKYLISAVQALRMTENEKLRPFIAAFVAELISTQDEDGYLGPFRKNERLLGQWDLWGHYHVMLGLLMWYEDTGDKAALDCSMRIADLVCKTYLNTDKTIWDAGSHEMNMAIIHSLGRLYRHTGDEKYLAMMQDVLVNWQRPPAGDYLHTALDGLDFYRTPKPRWESLHDIQGLTEMYEITGDEQYLKAYKQIWTSIRNYDIHPSGGFTTGEQAVGNPYSFGAIETCCTTAWMALTVDMLKLTGNPAAADELEIATWNSMLGSQHPSGRWWTYNTPLDGVREASAHTIVFQSRYGTSELNCCSVNAPRGLGMLSEWAVMVRPDGLLVNYYGAGESVVKLADGTGVSLKQETNYPAEGKIRLTVTPEKPGEFSISLRIPQWSKQNSISVNGQEQTGIEAGSYYTIERTWQAGDMIELSLDMRLRCWSGELARQNEAVIYRGPVLLTLDQKMSALDTNQAPQMDLEKLEGLEVEPVNIAELGEIPGLHFKPVILVDLPTAAGGSVRLCDFATAGAHGTAYRAWLPVVNAKPAWFHLKSPWNMSQVAPGPIKFEWSGQRASMQTGRTFRFELARDTGFKNLVHVENDIKKMQFIFDEDLVAGEVYWWQVTAINEIGETVALNGPWAFTINDALPRTPEYIEQIISLGPDEVLVSASLNGTEKPEYGMLGVAYELAQAPGAEGKFDNALSFNGATSRLTYELAFLPEEEYSVSIWAKPETVGTADFERIQQLMSLWAVILDDPLRISLQKGQVSARIETQGQFLSTAAFDLPVDQWANVAVVKDGASLSLYINGEMRSNINVPAFIYSAARNVGVGCNPNYGGVECFKGSLANFKLWARALTDEEIAKQYHDIAG